jgi:predicted outer membrane protein
MRNVYGWSMVAVVCLAGFGFAQNPAQPTRPGIGAQPGGAAAQPARPGVVQPGRPGAIQPVRPGEFREAGGQAASPDQQIAAFVLAHCRNEIEISKFAQDKLQSPEAKAFAEKMVREHSPGCEQIARIAGPLAEGIHVGDHEGAAPGADRPGALRPGARPGTDRPGADLPDADAPRPGATPRPGAPGADAPRPTPPADDQSSLDAVDATFVVQQEAPRADTPRVPRPGAAPPAGDTPRPGAQLRPRVGVDRGGVNVDVAGPAGNLDWNKIHKELADKCLQSTKEEFEKHQGRDFDQAYLGQQLLAHMQVVDSLEVLKNHASPQLRQILEKEQQMAQGHLEEVRQLMGSIKDSETPTRTAERPGLPKAKGPPATLPREE